MPTFVTESGGNQTVQREVMGEEIQKKEEELTSPPTPLLQGEGSKIPSLSAKEEELGGLGESESITHSETPHTIPIQAQLAIREPGDKYEQEADTVARQVVSQINAPQSPSVQREKMMEEEEKEVQRKPLISSLQRQEMAEEKEELQTKSESGTLQREGMPEVDEEEVQMKPMVQRQAEGGMAAPADLESSIQGARGGGQPLGDEIREPMEGAFGADFSGVRVHTDAKSDQLNQSIQAKAFTTGQDVFFRSGAYEPGSRGGQELLAHELTHVVQQKGSRELRTPTMHPVTVTTENRSADVQRTIDLSGVNEYPILQNAILNYSAIEQEDITSDEYEQLKAGRNRFIPLLGLFNTARNTTLIVGASSQKRETGDFAVTQLFCKSSASKWTEYDKSTDEFMQMLKDRKVEAFMVRILFWTKRVAGEEGEKGSLKRVGVIQQAFTHELTVHAENMLDFIEDYWNYVDKKATNPPQKLLEASTEHAAFKQGNVPRYEYMSARSKQPNRPTAEDFERREVQDKHSAN